MASSPYTFYEAMGYPLPRYKEFFAYGEEAVALIGRDEAALSRELNEQMQEYLHFVKRRQRIRKRIPFVDAVYLANSLTFNALREESDIDVFVVTREKRLRRARARTNTLFLLLGIKRRRTGIRKKFCLSFYVSREASSLLSVKDTPYDPYLIHRLAHLVPIYVSDEGFLFSIREENERIRNYLPNFPMRPVINLGLPLVQGSVRAKRKREQRFSGWIGDLTEKLIKSVWIPILLRKKRRLGAVGDHIIISNTMLKFHEDKRKKYQLLWKMKNNE